jgi:hypothetical protein
MSRSLAWILLPTALFLVSCVVGFSKEEKVRTNPTLPRADLFTLTTLSEGSFEVSRAESGTYTLFGSVSRFDDLTNDVQEQLATEGWDLSLPNPDLEHAGQNYLLAVSPDGERCWSYQNLKQRSVFSEDLREQVESRDPGVLEAVDGYETLLIVLDYRCV